MAAGRLSMLPVTILFGILGLGIMVFVHELGHFLAAKANGVAVEVFSLGWGPALVSVDHRGTRYQVSWFPLGGYCKMKGDEGLREAGRSDSDQLPAEPGSFFAAGVWRRIGIILAGPLANLLFAILVLSLIWWLGFRIDSPPNRIVLAADHSLDAVPDVTPAAAAGLVTGDRIVRVDGHDVANFQELRGRIAAAPERTLQLTVERDGTLLSAPITPELDPDTLAGRIWVYPWIEPLLEVRPGSAAAAAGLRSGDRVAAVDGAAVRHSIDVLQRLQQRPPQTRFTVERDGAELEIELPLADGLLDPGFSFRVPPSRSPRLGPGAALGRGVTDTWSTVAAAAGGFRLLFRGNPQTAVAGPLRITYVMGRAASDGFERGLGVGLVQFFRLLCLISTVLFVMNLLPLPALDGGHLALYVAELVRGKPLRPALIYRIQALGLPLLLFLAIAATFSDILFFAGR